MQETNDASGSPDVLNAWVIAAWPRAVVYARSLLRERAAAEDVVQDCICNLLRKADVYDLPRDGNPLLMKSVTNACLKRNTRARPTLSLNTATFDDDGGHGIDPEDIAEVQPLKVVLHAELERAVETALAKLPELQRAAIELKGLGHSLRDIAEILAVSPTNAGVLIHRGRLALAEQLAPYLENKQDERTGQRSAD